MCPSIRRRRSAWCAVPVVLVAGLLGPQATVHAAPGRDSCSEPQISFAATKGREVWIPSSRSAGPFQFGGTQSLSREDGKLNARTKGSADTVGGSGGVSFKIIEASAEYDHEWNRSTTTESSFAQTFTTTSPEVSRKVNWRWRLYKRGWYFVITKTAHIPVPCKNAYTKKHKLAVLVPTTDRLYSFDIETYNTRGRIHDGNGKPI